MFEALTQPKYPKAALGLEKNFITALALQKEGRGQFGIKQAATMELPEGLLNPSFIEHNIASPQEMLALIEEVCVKAGLGSRKRWSVSLPGNAARTAILTLDTPRSRAIVDTWSYADSMSALRRIWRGRWKARSPVSRIRISRFDEKGSRSCWTTEP